MSKFSDKCRELLIENGSNVYQLSTHFSLEHTTLQRMVTGKRLPKIDFVKNFCRSLRLSESEKEELLELYRREAMGIDAYNNERSIFHLMNHLKDLETNRKSSSIVSVELNHIEFHSDVSTESYNTELMMHMILTAEFSSLDDGFIYTNLPDSYTPFLHSLNLLSLQYAKKLLVQHLVHFHINASLSNKNLDIINHILPLFISDTLDYQVFYYYSRLTKNDHEHMLFPYYIITSKYILLLSSDFSKGFKLSDPVLINQYLKEFKQTCKKSKPLFQRVQMLDKAQSLYSISIGTESTVFHYQPCYGHLIENSELLNQIDLHLPLFYEVGKQFISSMNEKIINLNYIYFSDLGVEDFCNTGKYYGQVGTFFPPSTPQERVKKLKYFQQKGKLASNNIMIKGELWPFPKNLYFELQGTQLLLIIRIESFDKMDFIMIEENSICEAFYQFFHSLPSSKYAYTPEEMDAFFAHKIDQLT